MYLLLKAKNKEFSLAATKQVQQQKYFTSKIKYLINEVNNYDNNYIRCLTVKDYYRILNIKPDASEATIKQSFRTLAVKYHPDKNPDDVLSAAVFSEIAEAYSVLANPEKRKNYNNQRYYTAVSEYKKPVENIDALINKALDLKNKTAQANPFNFNREALFYFIKQLFPDDIAILLKTNQLKQQLFLETAVWLSTHLSAAQIKSFMQLTMPLFIQHAWMRQQLELIKNNQVKKERWEKYKTMLAFILALLLCALIFFLTKQSK